MNIGRGLEDGERAAGELDLVVLCFRRSGHRGRPRHPVRGAPSSTSCSPLLKLREGP
jgi:hypothetical protein